ncbi:MAG: hypothetical protein F4Y49_08645 [Dehalococcoidia bacterium]|nr:hypothetical protein [Dehalococcoidia bacterium]
MHRTNLRFWRHFDRLSESVQEVARENYELLKSNPRHPSLRFGKVGRYWSVRVGSAHRALAEEDSEGLVWFWIGDHDEYERLLRS